MELVWVQVYIFFCIWNTCSSSSRGKSPASFFPVFSRNSNCFWKPCLTSYLIARVFSCESLLASFCYPNLLYHSLGSQWYSPDPRKTSNVGPKSKFLQVPQCTLPIYPSQFKNAFMLHQSLITVFLLFCFRENPQQQSHGFNLVQLSSCISVVSISHFRNLKIQFMIQYG